MNDNCHLWDDERCLCLVYNTPEKLVGLEKAISYKAFTLYTQKFMMSGLSYNKTKDNFGVSDTPLCSRWDFNDRWVGGGGGANWIVGHAQLHDENPNKNPENFLPDLWMLLHPNIMRRYYCQSQILRQLINTKTCALRWSTRLRINLMNFRRKK